MDQIRQEVQISLEILKDGNHIQEAPDLEQFLNPHEELVEDSPEFLEEHILNSFLPDDPNEKLADEDEEVEQPKVEVEDALQCLEKLELYHLQQDSESSNERVLGEITKMRREIEVQRLRKQGNQVQRKITMYFSGPI